MGPGRDNVAGKAKSNKNMDPPTTKQRVPSSGSTWLTATPAGTSGTSAADVATAIDAVAKTIVSNNASNVQTTPCIPVKDPHEGSTLPNISRAKTSDPATIIKERASSKAVDSDEIESLVAPYRPVDVASPSSSKTLSGGSKSVGLGMSSAPTTTSKTASEARKSTAAIFNTVGMFDTATTAKKPITTVEASRRLFGGSFGIPSATTNPNTNSTPPENLFTMPKSSQTSTSVPQFGVPSNMSTPYVVPKKSEPSSLPIDFSTAPIPKPTATSLFGAFKKPDTIPTLTPTTNSPFNVIKTPIFRKPDLPTSDCGDGQAKGLFETVSEEARQPRSSPFGPSSTGTLASPLTAANLTEYGRSKSSPFVPFSTGSSAYPFTTANPSGFFSGNESSIKTNVPSIFEGSRLPPIQPVFNPKMATADGIPYTYTPTAPTYIPSSPYQPRDPISPYQPRDHIASSPFNPRTWATLPTAILTGDSTTQQPENRYGLLFPTQKTNEIKFDKPEDVIIYQRYAIQELQSSMAWLKEQNESVSHNVVILTENLGVCGAQLQYFSHRCDDLNDLCKERREETEKLQEELDKVNAIHAAKKAEESLMLEGLKKERLASQSIYFLASIVCILLTSIVYKK